MRSVSLLSVTLGVVILATGDLCAHPHLGEPVRVEMPHEDITLHFVEAPGGMAVQLSARSASVQGQKLYLGDGTIAVELLANNQGIWMQGRRFHQGDQFQNGSMIKVRGSFKHARELKPGDVYVVLPGVAFVEPAMLEAEWIARDMAGRRITIAFGADDTVRLSRGAETTEGTYTVAWYRNGPAQLDLDFGERGRIETILDPQRLRLRMELLETGAARPAGFSPNALVFTRRAC